MAASRSLSHLFRMAVRCQSTATAQKAASAAGVKIEDVCTAGDLQALMMRVKWTDGKVGDFPYVWLRDFAPTRRPAGLSDLNLAVTPETMSVSDDQSSIIIQWPPYLKADYTSEWLRSHLFPTETPASKMPPVELWDRHNFEEASKPWGEVQSCAETRAMLRTSFLRYGLCSVTACGDAQTKDVLKQLGGLIHAAPQEVLVKNANIMKVQGVHTGKPELQRVPNLVAMQWRSKTMGRGTFQVTDGFAVAADLKAENRAQFDFLTSNRIEFVDMNNDEDDNEERAAHHTIGLNPDGEVNRIVFNSGMRSDRPNLPPAKFGLLYRSLKSFNFKAYGKAVNVNIDPGEILFLNNHRVLHGNTAFANDTQHGPRTVEERYYNLPKKD